VAVKILAVPSLIAVAREKEPAHAGSLPSMQSSMRTWLSASPESGLVLKPAPRIYRDTTLIIVCIPAAA